MLRCWLPSHSPSAITCDILDSWPTDYTLVLHIVEEERLLEEGGGVSTVKKPLHFREDVL